MGLELGGCYHHLWKELVMLHALWHELKTLYAGPDRPIELMNETAPWFFTVCRDAMWRSIIIDLGKFADHAEIKKNKNISLLSLQEFLNEPLKGRVNSKRTVFMEHVSAVLAMRNKTIAHWDLSVKFGRAEQLRPVEVEQIDAALRTLRELLNEVESHYFSSSNSYEEPYLGAGNATALLHYLKKGRQAVEVELGKWKQQAAIGVEVSNGNP